MTVGVGLVGVIVEEVGLSLREAEVCHLLTGQVGTPHRGARDLRQGRGCMAQQVVV